MLRRTFNHALHVTSHDGEDHVGLAAFFPQVVELHDVGVVSEPAHGLGFPEDALATCRVQPLGPEEREGHIAV